MATLDRAQWIADARALLAILEANPQIPLNEIHGLEILHFPLSGGDIDDDQKMAVIDEIASLCSTPVTTPDILGSHYETEIRVGSARYRAVCVLKDQRDRWEAIQRLGEAALEVVSETAKAVA